MGNCFSAGPERPQLPPAIPTLPRDNAQTAIPAAALQGCHAGVTKRALDKTLSNLSDKDKIKKLEEIVKLQSEWISQSHYHLLKEPEESVDDDIDSRKQAQCAATTSSLSLAPAFAGSIKPALNKPVQQNTQAQLESLERVLQGPNSVPGGISLWTSPALPAAMQRPSWALSQFDALNLMHEGSTAVVWEALCRVSGQRVALKLYDHASLCSMGRAQLAREVRLHSAAYRHPHIIRLFAVFTEVEVVDDGQCGSSIADDISAANSTYSCRLTTQGGSTTPPNGLAPTSSGRTNAGAPGGSRPVTSASRADSISSAHHGHERRLVAIVQEMATGGNLLQAMFSSGGKLSEAHAVTRVVRPLLSALQHLHAQGVVHRDIKPENVVFDGSGALKLIDFGVAVDLNRERANTRAGTAPYMAPEVLACPLKTDPGQGKDDMSGPAHSTSVDVWALGCLLYEMLTGQVAFPHQGRGPPLEGEPMDSLYMPTRMSPAARDFISRCLATQATERPSVTELMRHPFLNAGMRAVHTYSMSGGDAQATNSARMNRPVSMCEPDTQSHLDTPLVILTPTGDNLSMQQTPPAALLSASQVAAQGQVVPSAKGGAAPLVPLGPAAMQDPRTNKHAKLQLQANIADSGHDEWAAGRLRVPERRRILRPGSCAT